MAEMETTVHATDPDGATVVLKAGDPAPSWYKGPNKATAPYAERTALRPAEPRAQEHPTLHAPKAVKDEVSKKMGDKSPVADDAPAPAPKAKG